MRTNTFITYVSLCVGERSTEKDLGRFGSRWHTKTLLSGCCDQAHVPITTGHTHTRLPRPHTRTQAPDPPQPTQGKAAAGCNGDPLPPPLRAPPCACGLSLHKPEAPIQTPPSSARDCHAATLPHPQLRPAHCPCHHMW